MLSLPFWTTMFLAGMAGSLVYSAIRPDKESWLKTLANAAAGTVTSFFLAPWFCEWREIDTIPGQHGSAFLLGLLAMIACRELIGMAEADGLIRSMIKIFKKTNGEVQGPPRRMHRPDSDQPAA